MLDSLMILVDDGSLGDGDSLLMPYVFTIFIDASGWIPCYMMPWSHELAHDGDDSDGCLMMALGP